MTTLVRVQTKPPSAIKSSVKSRTFATLTDDLSGTPTNYPKVTFQPVEESVINEIMGFVTLGLNDLNISEQFTPGLIYKWHIWLSRMNKWMKDNRQLYPKLLTLPDLTVPANLHFLSTIPATDSMQKQVELASTASLGPLLPADKGSLLNALSKGIDQIGSNHEQFIYKQNMYGKFIKDVNKIAMYAIEPLKTENNIKLPTVSTTTLPSVIKQIVETFSGNGTTLSADDNENNDVSLSSYIKSIPVWVWVAVLGIIFYLMNKSSHNSTQYGGGNKIRSISDFIQSTN